VPRYARYQGAIVHDNRILLIQQTEFASGESYWLIPGGGIEPGESEAACVAREMWEETNLRVRVERLLLDEPAPPGSIYQRCKTYLCRVDSGEASPGYEPEADAAATYAITAVGWFELGDPTGWPPLLCADAITFPLLQRIQLALGYVELPALG